MNQTPMGTSIEWIKIWLLSANRNKLLDVRLVLDFDCDFSNLITPKHFVTCRLLFTSLSNAAGPSLGRDDTHSDINLPMLLSGATRPS